MAIASALRFLGTLVAAACLLRNGGAATDDVSGRTLFVAPLAAGDASGQTRENAANFRQAQFWQGVRTQLAGAPVTVIFLAGKYVVSSEAARRQPALQLEKLGDEAHRLTIEGEKPDEVIFTRHPDDPRTGEKGPGFFFLRNSRNVTVRNLAFTGPHVPIGYATNFGSNQHVLVENCHWYDLDGVYYGATGTANETTDDITFKACRFERVGSGGHAHMIYNAYGPRHIRVIDCQFEDCAGDYVRFRDRTDYALVTGCTFRSTGKFTGVHSPFISIPLFNDDNPAEKKATARYEYFGTHFLFFNNRFIYDTEEKPAARIAVLFHHSGFNPPGGDFLLDRATAGVLSKGSPAEKKAVMREHLKVQAEEVHVYGNEPVRVAHRGVYQCKAAYGAKPRGGEGTYEIDDTFNATPVVAGSAQAREFLP